MSVSALSGRQGLDDLTYIDSIAISAKLPATHIAVSWSATITTEFKNRTTTWERIINNENLRTAGATHNNDKVSGEIILGEKYWDHDELTESHPGAMWTSSKKIVSRLNPEISNIWHTTDDLKAFFNSIAFWYVFMTVRTRRNTSNMVGSIGSWIWNRIHLRSTRKKLMQPARILQRTEHTRRLWHHRCRRKSAGREREQSRSTPAV